MKTTVEMSTHLFMIHIIFHNLTKSIIFQTATIRLLLMILWWMILGRKDPSLIHRYFVSFLGFVTHMVQSKDSLDIHTTPVNVRVKQKYRITEECSCFARLIPGLSRWFTWFKERFITKGFGGAILKYVTMVFWQLVLT